MNPAQLLNPKAYARDKAKKRKPNYAQGPQQVRKTPATTSEDVKVVLPKYDPKALLNPKAGSAATTNRASDNKMNGDPGIVPADQQDANLGRLYEKHHNVKNRDASATVKRSIEDAEAEDDDERKRQKTAFGASGRGGIISEHLKKEREALKDNNNPDTGPIDLTEEKEEEVQITSVKSPEVCLGLLDCKANCYRVPSPSIKSMKSFPKDHWPMFKITLTRGGDKGKDYVIDVCDQTTKPFGRIDLTTAIGLAPLIDGCKVSGLKLRAWVKPRRRREGEELGQQMSGLLEMVLGLYAPRDRADTIGIWLSSKQLFLRNPPNGATAFSAGRELYNPHDLKKDHRPKAVINGTLGHTSTTSTVSYSMRTVEEKERAYNKLFDDLSKTEDLPHMEADDIVIKTPLLAHQKQALHFMVEHEEEDYTTSRPDSTRVSLWQLEQRRGTEIWHNIITGQELTKKPAATRGGILADMMGLGKTLSILSLIAATKPQARDFRKEDAPPELGELGENSKATLIVCPNSVLSNWEDQVQTHVHKNGMRHYVYHGPDRTQDAQELCKYNIVLTTYGTLSSDFKANGSSRRALFRVNWFRVVLDEAHAIRNQATAYYKSACGLMAQRRWAVTGTPVQNRLEDLGALIAFLKVKPFDEPQAWAQYIISPFKTANQDVIKVLRILVDSITLRRTKDTLNDNLPKRTENIVRLAFTPDEKKLYSSFAARSNTKFKALVRDNKTLRGKSYMHILKSLLRLRMICDHGREMLTEEDLDEIKGNDEWNVIELGDEPDLIEHQFTTDRQAYDFLSMQIDATMDNCNACNERISKPASDRSSPNDDDADASMFDEDRNLMADGDVIGFLTPCFHLLHPQCYQQYVEEFAAKAKLSSHFACPYCGDMTRNESFTLEASGLAAYREDKLRKARIRKTANINPETYMPSTKINELVRELQASAAETLQLPAGEPPIRSVVFTEWTTFLDLVSIGLDHAGISYIRLDGSMSLRARSEVLSRFRDDPKATVLLVSIRAGGQGLNFTSANKVYLMEPQWNPGVEQQAVDRVHRLGQKRDVQITHYVMTDSVEEGMLRLQDKKIKLANLSMDKRRKAEAEDNKKRLEELRDLFK